MAGRHNNEFRTLDFALWLSDSELDVRDFFYKEDNQDTVSRIMELIGAVKLSESVVLVQELESLANQVLALAEELGLKEALLELFSLDYQPERRSSFVKASSAIEVLTFLIEKSDKYLLNHTTSILKEGVSLQDAIELLHRINVMSQSHEKAEVADNINHFCACYVDKGRWVLFKRDYYKHKHHVKTGKKTASLNGEAIDMLKKTQALLGLGNLSDTVLELVKRSGLDV